MQTAANVKAALKLVAHPAKAAEVARFFKTGKGQYGEGDKFLVVTVPEQRRIAKQFRDLSAAQLKKLLDDSIHECRLTALLILVDQYRRGDADARQSVVDIYIEKMDRVNNWDLVDTSADKILGAHLEQGDRSILYELAASQHLWRQRIAMIATHHFIKQHDFKDALRIARQLLDHPHDLIHKAVGWMLREIGNRDSAVLTAFLRRHYKRMPRTALRYAIEKFPEKERQAFLAGKG